MPSELALQRQLSVHAPEASQAAATAEAHQRIVSLLEAHFATFTLVQRRKIQALLGMSDAQAAPPPPEDALPRYWLPFSGQTWSGHGPVPPAFLAWEGTVAHTEWKRRHPDERFPRFPA